MKTLPLVLASGLLFGITAQGGPITYFATLNGSGEVPPNASPGTGTATVTIDTVAHTLMVDVMFSGLSAPTTASHIHCCTASPGTGSAGVATTVPTFTGFPLGVTSGTYMHTFDTTLLSSWNPAFVTANGGTASGAEAALAAGLVDDEAYLNIHTTAFPGGEISGFLVPIPEPGTFLVVGAALGFLLTRRKRWQSGGY